MNIAPSYTMSIKIGVSSFVDVFHSCESILPTPDLPDDGVVRSKPYSVDASYCVDAITSHPEYLEIEVAGQSQSLMTCHHFSYFRDIRASLQNQRRCPQQ